MYTRNVCAFTLTRDMYELTTICRRDHKCICIQYAGVYRSATHGVMIIHKCACMCAEVACATQQTGDKYLFVVCVSDLSLCLSPSVYLYICEHRVCASYIYAETRRVEGKSGLCDVRIIDVREWKICWAEA